MQERLRLLVADDEPLIRAKVLLMLGDRFRMDQVDTAAGARSKDPTAYDAVLLDIIFPDGNGIELCREIKEISPFTTVVVSSSMESVDAWNDAFRAGADGYLEKRELLGLDPRKIHLMIANLVDRNRLRRQAQETNRRQFELLSVLSHDVRAPFQALLGTIELLRKGPIAPDIADNVETLFHCVKDQLAFINSLLELLRLEAGASGLRPMDLDMNLPVHQSLQTLGVLARSKGIDLQHDLSASLPTVTGDVSRILQVVSNLVSNAIKFTEPGGCILVKTQAANLAGRTGVEIVVEDNGIGMTAQEQERIFQRFHKGRDRGTCGERGSGLGLAISKEIVQLHEGSLSVFSEKAKGTTMVAWFPGSSADDLGVPAACAAP